MTWLDDQLWLGTALLAAPGHEPGWERLGGDPARWQVYRRLVRARLSQTAEHAFPWFAEVIGRAQFAELLDAFLARGLPRSLYLRDVPGELLHFLESAPAMAGGAAAWPPWWRDLARYEWALLDAAYEPRRVAPELLMPLVMDAAAAIDPAHRLLRLAYPVHRAEAVAELFALVAAPTAVCVYRDARTHEIETVELNDLTSVILQGVAAQRGSLTAIVRDAALACGAAIDVPFIAALSEVLADFVERGLLLGSLAGPERVS